MNFSFFLFFSLFSHFFKKPKTHFLMKKENIVRDKIEFMCVNVRVIMQPKAMNSFFFVSRRQINCLDQNIRRLIRRNAVARWRPYVLYGKAFKIQKDR